MKVRIDYNDEDSFIDTISEDAIVGVKYTIKQDKNKYYINGQYVGEYDYSNFTAPGELYIFALNNNNSLYSCGYDKIYSFKIWDNGTLIRDYIPVHNTITNTAGLYDKVEGKFYPNSGTGSFTEGPEK